MHAQPTVQGDAGAHAFVTIGPKAGKASAIPQLSHLRSIADANPTPSAITTALPTTDDVDKHWTAVDNKQPYIDAAAELVDAYFDEKLPAPAPAVTAQVTAVIKVYRLVLDDEEAAADVDEIYTSIKATLTHVLEQDRKNPWALRVLHSLHAALGSGMCLTTGLIMPHTHISAASPDALHHGATGRTAHRPPNPRVQDQDGQGRRQASRPRCRQPAARTCGT